MTDTEQSLIDIAKLSIQRDLAELDSKRKHLSILQSLLDQRKDQFNQDNASELAELDAYVDSIQDISDRIRQTGLTIYEQTQDKDIHAGVKERDITTLSITDMVKAKEYCIRHSLFLLIDETALFRYLRTLSDEEIASLQFINKTTTPQITIPKDISKHTL